MISGTVESNIMIFSCNQAALWMAVHLSFCDMFFTMFPSSYHHDIFWNYYQWQKWCPCKRSRSKVKVKEITIQLNHFWTVTLVCSQIMMKWCVQLDVTQERCPMVFQGHMSNFKVTRLKKLSKLTQIGRFRTVTPVWIHLWLRNAAQSLK